MRVFLGSQPPLSGFINFHLDVMRKEHLQAFLKQTRPLLHKKIQEADGESAKVKDYSAQATDIIFDVLEQGARQDLLDGFVNVHANPSKLHTLIGGVRGDGAVVKQGLVKLKQKADVQLDAVKVGDVSLHKITLAANLPELQKLFDKKLEFIVGTGPKAIWYALGEDAEAKLKNAIGLTEKPAAAKSNVIASLHVQALLWYKLLDQVRLRNKKGNEEDRKIAIAEFEKGADTFDFKLELLDGKKLKSKLSFQEGMLRYFGKVAAKYVKDTIP